MLSSPIDFIFYDVGVAQPRSGPAGGDAGRYRRSGCKKLIQFYRTHGIHSFCKIAGTTLSVFAQAFDRLCGRTRGMAA
jgi:hypothetical protein